MTSNTYLFELNVYGGTCPQYTHEKIKGMMDYLIWVQSEKNWDVYSAATASTASAGSSAGAASATLTTAGSGAAVTTEKEYRGLGL